MVTPDAYAHGENESDRAYTVMEIYMNQAHEASEENMVTISDYLVEHLL